MDLGMAEFFKAMDECCSGLRCASSYNLCLDQIWLFVLCGGFGLDVARVWHQSVAPYKPHMYVINVMSV